MQPLNVNSAAKLLHFGEVLAYPTEAVFGLGCCPQNETALTRLLKIKQRSPEKGLILIASEVSQLLPYIDLTLVPKIKWENIQKTWPGPYTWVFPASEKVHPLVRGQYTTVAVRVTAHPVASQLCQAFQGAIVSTSANIATLQPFKNAEALGLYFQDKIAGTVEGEIGELANPTSIQDALTGEPYRV